ncbi:hypothetical protein K488DRAFT_74453 [Vararia minispora EC-137]|uniref:Uncharacterized protein n=1 Tax=Vararia minispora EC-137 TaxID=1314806 RepID=A0ACB8Q6Y8_9AGAM|nr:hypothetical protein K488DRAFT_74453 [Vararia minispora EC-137]
MCSARGLFYDVGSAQHTISLLWLSGSFAHADVERIGANLVPHPPSKAVRPRNVLATTSPDFLQADSRPGPVCGFTTLQTDGARDHATPSAFGEDGGMVGNSPKEVVLPAYACLCSDFALANSRLRRPPPQRNLVLSYACSLDCDHHFLTLFLQNLLSRPDTTSLRSNYSGLSRKSFCKHFKEPGPENFSFTPVSNTVGTPDEGILRSPTAYSGYDFRPAAFAIKSPSRFPVGIRFYIDRIIPSEPVLQASIDFREVAVAGLAAFGFVLACISGASGNPSNASPIQVSCPCPRNEADGEQQEQTGAYEPIYKSPPSTCLERYDALS